MHLVRPSGQPPISTIMTTKPSNNFTNSSRIVVTFVLRSRLYNVTIYQKMCLDNLVNKIIIMHLNYLDL